MKSDWEERKISDICKFSYGKNLHAKKRNPTGKIPVYGSNGVVGYHDEPYVREPGIIIGRKGTAGSVKFCSEPFWPIDTTFFIAESSVENLSYLYYLFKSIEFNRVCADSAVPGLNRQAAYSIKVLIPSNPNERIAIAEILSTLDDKINHNSRMNETLEAMARALFKDWFVDFGPTRAKMEGQDSYLAQEIWDLFPDKLDDKGKPEGWDNKPLDEIANFLNGLALQKYPKEEDEEGLPVIKIAELRNGITLKSNRATRNLPKEYIIEDGDFLFSWSASLLAKFWTDGEGALNQHLFKVTSEMYPKWFFSEWVHHHLKQFQLIAASKATTMGHIQRKHLTEAQVVCPKESVLNALGDTISPLVERSIKNDIENQTLAQTRDILLPRLISGKLKIADAEKFIEKVGA